MRIVLIIAALALPWRSPSAFAAEHPQRDERAAGKPSAKEEKEEEHKPADPDTGKSSLSPETLGIVPNPYLDRGLKLTLTYVGEALANTQGGLARGAIYDGRLNVAVDVDFEKLRGWSGLTFHGNVFQIHGRGLSRHYVGNLMLASSIEALSSTRLYEAWLEQKFHDRTSSIRFGQLAADTEFITSRYTDVFINSTYGWPTIAGVNLPSGGPSPPLAAVGARVKLDITDNDTVLAAIFNGNSAGPGENDPQSRNRHGLNFRTSDSPLVIGEYQHAHGDERSGAMPGVVKIGGWYHTGEFADQRFAANRLSQADPNAAPTPASVNGNFGVYGVVDQLAVRFGAIDEKRGVGVFLRGSASPSGRNLIDRYVDGGVTVIGLSKSRPADKIGIGFAYSRISAAARDLDRDFRLLAQDARPVRDHEILVALSYLAEIRPGWTVLPTLQYFIHPGGGYVLDEGVAKPLKNSLVIGARTVLKF